MDIKELIKSIDTEGILDAETVDTLVKTAEESIAAKCALAKEEGKKEAKEESVKEAAAQVQEAEKAGYKKGVEATLTETEQIVKEAEKSGYEAGVKVALEEAEREIKNSKIGFLFAETRGQEPYNAKELAGILLGLSQLAREILEIAEFDINPLLIYNDGKEAVAVDVKIVI